LVSKLNGIIRAQICQAIEVLSAFYPDDKKRCHEIVDKLWCGILDKTNEMTVDTIVHVFRALPHLKQVWPPP
jgi:hypothetical protein